MHPVGTAGSEFNLPTMAESFTSSPSDSGRTRPDGDRASAAVNRLVGRFAMTHVAPPLEAALAEPPAAVSMTGLHCMFGVGASGDDSARTRSAYYAWSGVLAKATLPGRSDIGTVQTRFCRHRSGRSDRRGSGSSAMPWAASSIGLSIRSAFREYVNTRMRFRHLISDKWLRTLHHASGPSGLAPHGAPLVDRENTRDRRSMSSTRRPSHAGASCAQHDHGPARKGLRHCAQRSSVEDARPAPARTSSFFVPGRCCGFCASALSL